MSGSADFDQRDPQPAQNIGDAARINGVERNIYLGGLEDPQTGLSKHLRLCRQAGQALTESRVPVTEFRAAMWWDRAAFRLR
jgi:uncharacterized protein YbjT (DUF2867 family)